MDNQEIGRNIVQLRKKHGLSQRELADHHDQHPICCHGK
jgi:HTH-type transcriptional repressor of puuD